MICNFIGMTLQVFKGYGVQFLDFSISELQLAVERIPDYYQPHENLADTYVFKAKKLVAQGVPADNLEVVRNLRWGIEHYGRALEVLKGSPLHGKPEGDAVRRLLLIDQAVALMLEGPTKDLTGARAYLNQATEGWTRAGNRRPRPPEFSGGLWPAPDRRYSKASPTSKSRPAPPGPRSAAHGSPGTEPACIGPASTTTRICSSCYRAFLSNSSSPPCGRARPLSTRCSGRGLDNHRAARDGQVAALPISSSFGAVARGRRPATTARARPRHTARQQPSTAAHRASAAPSRPLTWAVHLTTTGTSRTPWSTRSRSKHDTWASAADPSRKRRQWPTRPCLTGGRRNRCADRNWEACGTRGRWSFRSPSASRSSGAPPSDGPREMPGVSAPGWL